MSAHTLRVRRSPHSSSSDEPVAGTEIFRKISQDCVENSRTNMATVTIQPFSDNSAIESLAGRLNGDRLELLKDEGMELYRVKVGGGEYQVVGASAAPREGASVAPGGMLNYHWTVLERPLCDDDTVANLALRYNCSIDDLKRLNRIIRDQELYALRNVRIPVLRHGVTEERLVIEDRERMEAHMYKERRKTGSCSDTDYAATDEEADSHSLSSISRTRHNPLHPSPFIPTPESNHPESNQDPRISKMFKAADDDLRSVTESLLAREYSDDGLPVRHRKRIRGPSADGMSFFGGYISSRTVILVVVLVGAGVLLFGALVVFTQY